MTQALPDERVPLAELFVALLKVSLFGIGGGGGLLWARRIAVEQRGWVSEQDFADIVSLCQLMPGPNIVGIATCIGARLRGLAGAVTAIAGFMVIPWAIGFGIGVLCLQNTDVTVLRNILHGVSAPAAGLLIAVGIKMLLPHRTRAGALLFAAAAFGLMAIARLPLPVVLLAVAPISVAVAALQRASPR